MNPALPPLVMHVVFRFDVGGLENGVVNLVNRMPHDLWRHAIVSLTEVDPTFATRIERRDVPIVALSKGPGHAVKLYGRIYRLIRDLRPSIVHTRNLAALEAMLPAWAAGVPNRVHGEHGRDVNDLDGANRRYQWVRRAFRPFVTRYVALAPDLEKYLRESIGVAPGRIEQIYNGVDTGRFVPSPEAFDLAECPFRRPEHWLVGTVGRMEAVKDQTNLARAFVRALRLHPEARQRMRLVLVGDGALRPEVEAVLAEGEARELAWFAGVRSNVVPLLQGLDCFVLPSLAEGVSNTILEAMACALPVIATKVGANADLIEDRLTGQLVPRSDSEALASAIVEYFVNPRLARRHGRAGRQVVENKFSLERMVERYARLYSGLMASADAGPSATQLEMGRRRAVDE